MDVYDSSREEEIDEPELNVDDYLYCKISGNSNYDDYLCKKTYMKLPPQKVLEEIDDPELFSQLSNSVISFLKRSQKMCENSSVSNDSASDSSEHNVNNSLQSPLVRERGKCFSSQRSVKEDSLLYLQLSKEDGGRNVSSSNNINKEYQHSIDFQQTMKRIPSPQHVIKKAIDANNIVPFEGEKFGSNQQERKLLPSTVNNNDNNNNMSPQSIQDFPIKYITKVAEPVKSIKNNITTSADNNNKKDYQQKHEDIVNITLDNNNNKKQNNNNIIVKTFKNVALNFSKQYHNYSNIHSCNKSDMTNYHNECNNNNNNNNNNDVTNSKMNSNDVMFTNQLPQSKILYRHLTSENNKFYNGGGKNCLIPLSGCTSNENLMNNENDLESSAPPSLSSSSPTTLKFYAATAGVPNIICEKANNFTIPKATMLKTIATTTAVKNIVTQEPLQQQQQQRALNIFDSGNSNNYDSIITLSLENSNNNNNQNSSGNNKNHFSDNNNNNSNNNSEIVIEIGDKNKPVLNSTGSIKEITKSLNYQHQQQQTAPTMVCLKRRGDMHPLLPQQYNNQKPPLLFNRSHMTHIVERRSIPSNSSTNKYETTFIQKRSEQLLPIQPCRILDNKQIIKQYCGPKIKSEKRNFSAIEPVVLSSVISQNGSPVCGGTVKGVSNEQMSSLQRLLKLGTTATVMSNKEKKIKLETIVKKLWAKELSEPTPLPPSSN